MIEHIKLVAGQCFYDLSRIQSKLQERLCHRRQQHRPRVLVLHLERVAVGRQLQADQLVGPDVAGGRGRHHFRICRFRRRLLHLPAQLGRHGGWRRVSAGHLRLGLRHCGRL